ncbi:MAG: hypothetical protein DRO40_10730, partial [Thermoprotei archaeon]
MAHEKELMAVLAMCRLAFIYSENQEFTKKIIDAVIESSRNDKYKVAIGAGPSHGDGWGVIAFSLDHKNKVEKAYNYATITPIYDDTHGTMSLQNFLSKENRIALAIHSRFVSSGIVDIFNTHPIIVNGEGRDFTLWIAHNGTMNKELLAKELGLEPIHEVTDTYYLGLYVFRNIKDLEINELVSTFKQASKYTKTAMNTINMFYSIRKGLHTVVTCYLNDELKQKRQYIDYYKLYLLKADKTIAITSSTIADILRDEF